MPDTERGHTVPLGSRRAAQALRTRFLAYLDREDTLTWSYVFTVRAQPVPSRTG